jgi:hypothetical protein
MTARVGWLSWSLELPPNWRATEHPECLTLELSDEGALQLSSASKQDGNVSYEDILDYAESQNHEWGVSIDVTCGEFTGLVYRYREDEQQWNRWFLRNGQTLLFVTYNASRRAQLFEYAAVEQILSTLRAEAAA